MYSQTVYVFVFASGLEMSCSGDFAPQEEEEVHSLTLDIGVLGKNKAPSQGEGRVWSVVVASAVSPRSSHSLMIITLVITPVIHPPPLITLTTRRKLASSSPLLATGQSHHADEGKRRADWPPAGVG